MLTSDLVKEKIIKYINDDVLEGQGYGINADTELLALGIIDSLTLVSLVNFISKEFSIEVPQEKIVPEEFLSVNTIACLIQSLQAN
jgi:acyl carrier protein